MGRAAYLSGSTRTIWYYSKSDDFGALDAWISEQPLKDRKGIANRFRIITESAEYPKDKKAFTYEFDGIWAIKVDQCRFYGCKVKDDFEIFLFLRKKQDKISKKEMVQIKQKYKEYSSDVRGTQNEI